jgi:hypothetical protein
MNDRAYSSWRRLFERLFREGQAVGEIRSGDAGCMASAFVAMMDVSPCRRSSAKAT